MVVPFECGEEEASAVSVSYGGGGERGASGDVVESGERWK